MRGLRIVLLCLALGVARDRRGRHPARGDRCAGWRPTAARILGGDLEVDGGSQPLPDTLRDWLRARGARLSDVVQMRSMLVAPSGERQLVELKAVDAAWPLVGAVGREHRPTRSRAALGAAGLADHRPARRTGGAGPARPASRRHRRGSAPRAFAVRGALIGEPDRVAAPLHARPARADRRRDALPATGLIAPGSMVHYALRADRAGRRRLSPAASARRLPQPGLAHPRPARRRARGEPLHRPDRLFLTLVGLTSLLVGGIGVANGVRAWLDARARTIATLRCLGASAALVLAVCLIQVLALAAAGHPDRPGGRRGCCRWPRRLAADDVLPVPPVLGLYPGPLALAALTGC